ncbi:MAG: hypothetical protein ACOCYB_09245 [Alkalispirochaeta sp.]
MVAVLWVASITTAWPVAAQISTAQDSTVIPGSPPADISREVLVQSDHEGVMLQRVTADIGGTQWLWRTRGTVLLYEETALAGGYIERRRLLGTPAKPFVHHAGCAVGPLTVGPLQFRGVYHRVLDPTAGGTRWSSLTDDDDLRLDRGLSSPRRTGVGVTGMLPFSFFGGDIVPGAVWGTTADGENDVGTTALILNWPVAAAAFALSRGTFSVAEDHSWLYAAPPFRTSGVTQVGSTLKLTPAVAEVPVHIGAEGWQQRNGYRPPRSSVGAFAHASGTRAAVATRVSRTDSGFRALSGRRPRWSRYVGATVSQGRRGRPWVWQAEWQRRAGWQEDRPGEPVNFYSGAVGGAWRRGVLRGLRMQGTQSSTGRSSVSYRLRCAVGPVGLLAHARHAFQEHTDDDSFSATARASLRTDLGRHARRFSADAGWSGTAERRRWEHELSLNASTPVGGALRLELSAKQPLIPAASTTEWMVRLRHTGPNARRGTTTPK